VVSSEDRLDLGNGDDDAAGTESGRDFARGEHDD
jgi:hypothetical protein